jgi:hypothetical protein
MNRISRILIPLVSLAIALYVALFVAAYMKPKSNKIAVWRTNLEAIESAKQVWESNEVIKTNDSPTLDDLRPYLSGWATNHIYWTNGELVDPDGGVYTIGRVGESPSCLIGGVRKVYP